MPSFHAGMETARDSDSNDNQGYKPYSLQHPEGTSTDYSQDSISETERESRDQILPTSDSQQPHRTAGRSEKGQGDGHNITKRHEQIISNNKPDFSLAGSSAPWIPNQGVAYVHPLYQVYNPHYGKNQEGPVWGLAQPLPHVLRDGMRSGEDKKGVVSQNFSSPGSTEGKGKEEDPAKRVSKPDKHGLFNTWGRIRHYFREPLAE